MGQGKIFMSLCVHNGAERQCEQFSYCICNQSSQDTHHRGEVLALNNSLNEQSKDKWGQRHCTASQMPCVGFKIIQLKLGRAASRRQENAKITTLYTSARTLAERVLLWWTALRRAERWVCPMWAARGGADSCEPAGRPSRRQASARCRASLAPAAKHKPAILRLPIKKVHGGNSRVSTDTWTRRTKREVPKRAP